MQINALLFDLGRVVLDVDFARVVAAWARDAGRDPRELQTRFAAHVQGSEAYCRHERGEISDAAFFDEVRSGLRLALDDVAMLRGWNDIFEGEVAGISALLSNASRRVPLYALSNTNPAHEAHFRLHYADILSHFRKLYLSHEMGLRKPEPGIYRVVAEDLGHRPGEILFFDDLAANVEAARACGMQAVLFRSVEDVEVALGAINPD